MRRSAALALVVLAAGCGGHSMPRRAATYAPTTKPTAAPVRVTISAATHTPKANAPWPVTIRVTDASGKPIAARLTMRILFGGAPVGKVDNGRVYRFVGSWQEKKGQEITWPAASRGQPLAFEAVVTANGVTAKRDWAIRVR